MVGSLVDSSLLWFDAAGVVRMVGYKQGIVGYSCDGDGNRKSTLLLCFVLFCTDNDYVQKSYKYEYNWDRTNMN